MEELTKISEGKIKESIKEEMSKLKKSHQLAINSFDWLKKCQEIGEKFNLTNNEIHGLKVDVILVLMGLSNLDTLRDSINNEIGGTCCVIIYNSIFENILVPVVDLAEIIESYDINNQTLFYFEDIYNLDLPVLLQSSTLSGTRPLKNCDLTMKYYDCVLEPTFLNAFDVLRIGLVWEEKEIKNGPLTLDLTFLPKNKKLNNTQISYVADTILKSCEEIPDQAYGLFDVMCFKEGTCSFMVFDHPNGHEIGVSQNENIGVSVDINVTYEDFLRCRNNKK